MKAYAYMWCLFEWLSHIKNGWEEKDYIGSLPLVAGFAPEITFTWTFDRGPRYVAYIGLIPCIQCTGVGARSFSSPYWKGLVVQLVWIGWSHVKSAKWHVPPFWHGVDSSQVPSAASTTEETAMMATKTKNKNLKEVENVILLLLWTGSCFERLWWSSFFRCWKIVIKKERLPNTNKKWNNEDVK